MARVNTETATEVQEKYGINQFPYLVMFRNGQLYPYEGPGERAGVPGIHLVKLYTPCLILCLQV